MVLRQAVAGQQAVVQLAATPTISLPLEVDRQEDEDVQHQQGAPDGCDCKLRERHVWTSQDVIRYVIKDLPMVTLSAVE